MISLQENIEKLQEYILEHLGDALTVSELAERFTLNESTLRKQFSRQYHKTLHRFILEQRMEMAHTLLKEGRLTIAEVGEKVGYCEASNFSHAFSKHYGISPKKIAKQHCIGTRKS